MDIVRTLKHLLTPPWLLRRQISRTMLRRIEQAIADSERTHLGEPLLVIETVLPWRDALRGMSARERAIEIFSEMRVWDTEYNSGVLIYLLLADRDIEIVADRGIHAKIGEAGWDAICSAMEKHLHEGEFEAGLMEGLRAVSTLLRHHFPTQNNNNPDELPNHPVLL